MFMLNICIYKIVKIRNLQTYHKIVLEKRNGCKYIFMFIQTTTVFDIIYGSFDV